MDILEIIIIIIIPLIVIGAIVAIVLVIHSYNSKEKSMTAMPEIQNNGCESIYNGRNQRNVEVTSFNFNYEETRINGEIASRKFNVNYKGSNPSEIPNIMHMGQLENHDMY